MKKQKVVDYVVIVLAFALIVLAMLLCYEPVRKPDVEYPFANQNITWNTKSPSGDGR